MSGHTEGPWKDVWSEDRGRHLQAQSGAQVMTLWGTSVNDANARLIAAAPDLLAALQLAAEALDAYSDVNDGQDGPTPNRAMSALQEIGAVIAKAEGKPR